MDYGLVKLWKKRIRIVFNLYLENLRICRRSTGRSCGSVLRRAKNTKLLSIILCGSGEVHGCELKHNLVQQKILGCSS